MLVSDGTIKVHEKQATLLSGDPGIRSTKDWPSLIQKGHKHCYRTLKHERNRCGIVLGEWRSGLGVDIRL